MKRVIVDYQKLTPSLLDLLAATYPEGYTSKDVVVFRNAQNEVIEAVEVKTEDTVYLIKVSKRLADTLDNYLSEEDDWHDEDEDDDDLDDTSELVEDDVDDTW